MTTRKGTMNRSLNLFLPVTLASLVLLTTCSDLPSGLPTPVGYDGFLEQGWLAIGDGEYSDAYDCFEQAIEIDVLRADGYLGAAVSCIYQQDRWGLANDFLQTAVQQDLGHSAVTRHLDENLVQDVLWTVFECMDPDLPADSLDVWLAMTGDSGAVWVGQQIHDFLTRGGYDTSLEFRFQPGTQDCIACTGLHNGQSGADYGVDSIYSGWIYLDVPEFEIKIGEVRYYTWIMVGQNVSYDWAVCRADGGTGQITQDAMAAWTLLEEVQGVEGDLLQAVACSQGLLQIRPGYSFGEGDPIRDGFYDIGISDVVASGATLAFLKEQYIYAWFLCTRAGYGLEIDPEADDFLLVLLQLLSDMKS